MTSIDENLLVPILSEILREIKNISEKVSYLTTRLDEEGNEKMSESKDIAPTSLDIMDLQEKRPGIFRTYKTIQKKDDWVTSTEIAEITKRSRGLESRYLNYLAESNLVEKKREKVSRESKATEVFYKIKILGE